MKKVEFSGEVARTPEEVYAALTSPDFWRDYAKSSRLSSAEVTSTAEGAGHVVRMSATVPTPSQARALAGDSADVRTEARWASPSAGVLRVDVVAKKKADVVGTISITPAGAGTRLGFSGELNVRVPFLGGTIEGQVVKYVPSAFDDLARQLAAWQG